MKLATFTADDRTRIGVVIGDEIADTLGAGDFPTTMNEFLAAGPAAIDRLGEWIGGGAPRLSLAEIKPEPPTSPSKYLAVSLNYADHIRETGRETPEFPTFFNKQVSCVIGTGDAIHRPKVSDKLDYEGELALVIGRRCRHVPISRAHEVIAGYTIANDVSVRDWQVRSHTWTLGKSFDTHGPLGPWLVTSDEIGDPHDLGLRTWVNDDLRQSSNTANLIFNCYQLVAYLSTVMTLLPGDVISTGTPSGVGVMMKPRGYLTPGDRVRVEIEKIGALENPVVEEPDETSEF